MKYLITFYQRNDKGHRLYRWDEEFTWRNGKWTFEATLEDILEMMQWVEQSTMGRMLKSYNIDFAYTDVCPSSIIIDLKADTEEAMDELLVTLKMFGGGDVRIQTPEQAALRRHNHELRLREKSKDRYAR